MTRHTTNRRQFVTAVGTTGVLVAGAGIVGARGRPNRNFRAHLSALPGIDSDAQGQAKFQLSKDGTELDYKLIVANIENVTMAHIHLRPSGGVAVWLYPEGGPPPELIPGRFDGVLAEGTITDDGVGGAGVQTLDGLIDELRAGNGFVRVHTDPHPGGEIEGDIH